MFYTTYQIPHFSDGKFVLQLFYYKSYTNLHSTNLINLHRYVATLLSSELPLPSSVVDNGVSSGNDSSLSGPASATGDRLFTNRNENKRHVCIKILTGCGNFLCITKSQWQVLFILWWQSQSKINMQALAGPEIAKATKTMASTHRLSINAPYLLVSSYSLALNG